MTLRRLAVRTGRAEPGPRTWRQPAVTRKFRRRRRCHRHRRPPPLRCAAATAASAGPRARAGPAPLTEAGDLSRQVAGSAERREAARRRVLRSRRGRHPRRGDARTLQKNADWMKKWTTTQVTVEGHCDSRGSSEYNLAPGLAPGQRREGLPDESRRAGRPGDDHQQGQGTAVLQ